MYCGAIHLSLPPSRISLWTISSCLLFHWLNWENGTPPSATIKNSILLFISYILSHPNSVRHGFHLIQWALNLLCSSLKSYLHKHVSPRGCFPAWGLSIPYNIVNLNKTIRENNSKQNNAVSLGSRILQREYPNHSKWWVYFRRLRQEKPVFYKAKWVTSDILKRTSMVTMINNKSGFSPMSNNIQLLGRCKNTFCVRLHILCVSGASGSLSG